MHPRIEVASTLRVRFSVERRLRRLLRSVPPEDLVDLGEILVTDRLASPRGQPVRGLYWPKKGAQPARIAIALRAVYKGVPHVVLWLPFVPHVLLASAFFHEVAHHHLRLRHGVSKQTEERLAEEYSDMLVTRAFRTWLTILRPLRPLVRLVNQRAQRRASAKPNQRVAP